MDDTNRSLIKEIEVFCKKLEEEFDLIPQERKDKLTALSDYISNKFQKKEVPKIIVICTHNSRRSHLGQIWLAAGADYFDLPEIKTYSGGTEATAFNIRSVDALRRIGFQIKSNQEPAANPVYEIRWKQGMEPYQAFSKKYDNAPNPKEKFAAVMVCSEADEACPFVFGTDFRLSLPFQDPKEYDGTVEETTRYDERCRQIGREMLFALSYVKTN